MDVTRPHKYQIHITFERSNISDDVIKALDAFNEINDIIYAITNQYKSISQALKQLVKREDELKKEVTLAAIGRDGPESLKHTIDGFVQIKRAKTDAKKIYDYAISTFEDMKRAARTITDN